MYPQTLRLITLLTLLATLSSVAVVNLPGVFTASRVLAQTVDGRKAEADRLLQQGIEQFNSSQYETALQLWQQALVIYREIKDRQGEGWVLGNLGIAYRNLGDYGKAIDYQQQLLAIAREIKDRKSEGAALGNLGAAYLSLGNYTKAIDYLEQTLAIAREIKDRNSEGVVLGNLGIAYLYLGDYAKAINYFEQDLVIARGIKNRNSEGKVLGNLGIAYSYLGDYAKAINYFKQDLVIAREIKNRNSEGGALGNLGAAYLSLGDYAKAINYLNQNLVIAREIKNRNSEGGALGNLGAAYSYLGDYAKAIDYLEQQLAITLENKDRNSEGKALGNLGLVYLYLGDYGKAIDYQQQSLAIAREIKDRNSEGTALNNLGLAFYKSGKLSAAETTLFEGIRVKESLRRGLNDANKVSIFEQQFRTYRALQQVLIAQNKTDTALEIAERGRARAFVELLASRLNLEEKPQAPKIEQIKQIAKAQNATLVQYSIIKDDFKVAGKQQTKESELYIWVIKPTGEVTFRKADLKPLWQKENTDLAELVINSRESIGARGRGIDVSYNPDAGKAQNNLKRLHELLIKPIADVLPKNSSARVIFIPQDSLFLVPFPALRDENGKYLIEKHTILTSPSIQVLDLTRQQRNNTGTQNLIVGNPQMPKLPPKIGEPPQQLPPLPGAETEAKAIASLLNTKPLIGSQATESEVVKRLPQARIIHLATHGIFNDVQGLNSGVALTPSIPPSSPLKKGGSQKNDGLLTAGEIFDLKLNADLVVLSACDTGRGKITGDGVVGLSRSFISAGVPSVLVSLWSVPDAPTASLMTEFYQNLSKNSDKATALRQAMLTTMKQHPAPKDWAAFTLIGEAD